VAMALTQSPQRQLHANDVLLITKRVKKIVESITEQFHSRVIEQILVNITTHAPDGFRLRTPIISSASRPSIGGVSGIEYKISWINDVGFRILASKLMCDSPNALDRHCYEINVTEGLLNKADLEEVCRWSMRHKDQFFVVL
jgi:hypothetical protein